MRKLANEELGRISVDEFKSSDKTPIVIVLDNIRSLNNIGSVFRTADAFRLEKIYLCGITAQPPHRDIHKTALGATDSVEWVYYDDTQKAIEELKSDGYQVTAVEQADQSTKLDRYNPASGKVALIFGNEVFGVKEEVIKRSDLCVEIPQLGTKHSLNISVSVGIVVWDLWSKMRAVDE